MRGRLDLASWTDGIIPAIFIAGSGAAVAVGSGAINDPQHFNWLHWRELLSSMVPAFLVCGFLGGAAFVWQNGMPTIHTSETKITTDKTGISIETTETTQSSRIEGDGPQ